MLRCRYQQQHMDKEWVTVNYLYQFKTKKKKIDGSPLKGLCPNICQQHFNGTLEQIGSWKNKLIHLDVAGNDFTGVFPASLCAIKECTAWGNQFDKPLRPKTCCAGLTNDEEMNVPIGYDCHPHNFPT